MDGCQFEKKTFQVAVGSPSISQEDWDKAFSKPKKSGRRGEPCSESTDTPETKE